MSEETTVEKRYLVTLTDALIVPSEIVADNGSSDGKDATSEPILRFKLPDGRIVRPYIGYELIDEVGGEYEDLTYQELCDLGILSGDDVSKTIVEID